MVSNLAIVVASSIVLLSCYQIQNLRENIAKAKSSGFKYVVLPFNMLSIPWALTQPVLLPLLDCLPENWTEGWLPLLVMERGWYHSYEPFRRIGADTFIVVSPTRNVLYTCEPQLSTQFLRGKNFTKPAELLEILNIFGPTMTGTDGQETRLYRKITAPFFNNRTMQHVWTNSVDSAGLLMKVLTEENASVRIKLREMLARMALHILNVSCFEGGKGYLDELRFQEQIPSGYNLSYVEAMHSVLKNFANIFLTPSLILNNSPLRRHKKPRQAYVDLRRYMEELRDRKKIEIIDGKSLPEAATLLDLIVRAGEAFDGNSQAVLSPNAVLGNIFIFMFAGHEASANTIHFIILLLACHPRVQSSLQMDIDRVLGDCPVNQWSYETHFSGLMESLVGAVINETLRLYTVLPFILKATVEDPQSVIIDGCTHVIPSNTIILMNTSATHRNPKHWSEPQDYIAGTKPHPVAAFNPWKWLNREGGNPGKFFLPKTGSFIPFSDGSRGCLGNRFSMVELCAIVTRIFSEFSVELAVGELTPVSSREEKKTGWEASRSRSEFEMSSKVEFKMSLRMEGYVPVNFVRRGEEKFAEF